MPEEIKERLSKTEYDKVGEMLLELIAECPYIPVGANIKYNSKDVGKCVYIITAGEISKAEMCLGIYGRIDYPDCLPKFPTGQRTDDKCTGSSGQHYRVA